MFSVVSVKGKMVIRDYLGKLCEKHCLLSVLNLGNEHLSFI